MVKANIDTVCAVVPFCPWKNGFGSPA